MYFYQKAHKEGERYVQSLETTFATTKGGTEKKIMFNGPKILKIFPKKRLMRKNGTHPIVLSLSLFFSI